MREMAMRQLEELKKLEVSTPQRKKIELLSTPERRNEIGKLSGLSAAARTEYLHKKFGTPPKPPKMSVRMSRPGMEPSRDANRPAATQFQETSFKVPRQQRPEYSLERSDDDQKDSESEPYSIHNTPPSSVPASLSGSVSDFEMDDVQQMMSGQPRRMRPTPESGDLNLFMRMRGEQMEHMSARRLRLGGTPSSVRSRYTFGTGRAQMDFPIPGYTIVRLNEIKRRMGKKVDLFDDSQAFGFNRKHWEKKLFKKFPIDFSEGFKQHLGSFIKTSFDDRKREFQFVVRRKATMFQINSLIAVIESKPPPPFHHVDSFIKRKVWEEVYNLSSLYGLQSFITNSIKDSPKIHMKLTW